MALAILNRFLHWMVIGVLSPVMVLMIISKGIPLDAVGYVMALLSATVVLFELPSGILSDRIGRKTVYLISLAVFLLSLAVILSGRGFPAIAAGFCLFGFARALSSGSIESDFIDLHIARRGKEDLHRLVTGMQVGETLGLAAGALLGGVLPDRWSAIFPDGNRFHGNLIVAMVIIAALSILTSFAHPGAKPYGGTRLRDFLRETQALAGSNPTIRYLLAGTAIWGFSFGAVELYWQPRLGGIIGADGLSWVFGALNSGYFLMSAAGALLVGLALSRRGVRPFVLVGILKLLLGSAIAALAFQGSFPGFAALFLAIMGCNGMVGVPESTLLNAEIPDDKRASMLSLGSLVMQGGGIVGSVLCSLVVASAGIGAIWVVAGAAFAASSFLSFRLDRLRA